MTKPRRLSLFLTVVAWTFSPGCGGDSTDPHGAEGIFDASAQSGGIGGGDAGATASGGSTAGGSTAGGSTAGGSTPGGSTAGGSTAGGSTAGGPLDAGSGGSADGTADAGSSQDAGGSGEAGADAGAPAGDGGGPSTQLTGMLGTLGAVKPTVSSFVITNSGETLIYLSSAPITCEMLMAEGGRWLQKVASGAQVIEIVVKGTPSVGAPVNVGLFGGEVNYAPGGMSSAYETGATSGSITFTKSEPMGVVEGSVTAQYPSGSVMGTFHAEFCPGGQQY